MELNRFRQKGLCHGSNCEGIGLVGLRDLGGGGDGVQGPIQQPELWE